MYEIFRNPVAVDKATDFKRADKNTILIMFMEKLPAYLSYATKYEGYSNNKVTKASYRRSINHKSLSQKYYSEANVHIQEYYCTDIAV